MIKMDKAAAMSVPERCKQIPDRLRGYVRRIRRYVGSNFRSAPTMAHSSSTNSGSMIISTLTSIYHTESMDIPQKQQDGPPLQNGDYFILKFIALVRSLAQVIAFICGLIVIILMTMGLLSTDWLMAAGWRQGLFRHCIEEDAPTPLPFNTLDPAGCYESRDAPYIKAAAALCIITLVTDVIATVLTGLGLRSKDHRTKYNYYKFAVLVMLLALISILIALVIYPVCFAAELNLGNRTVWEFGWAYGVGWGAAIFLFGGVILLLCDKESEEIYYKERKIVHDSDSRA